MSELHNALLRGPWSAAVQNALGVTKGEGGVERYGETLTPVMDLWTLPEWRYLRRERTGALGLLEGVGAGRSRLGVRNISTNDLVVVEYLENRGVAGSFLLSLGTGNTVDSSEFFRPTDTRFYTANTGSLSSVMATHRQGTVGGTQTDLSSFYMTAGILYPVDIILAPGWHLSIDPSADATQIALWVRVRERVAQRGEL